MTNTRERITDIWAMAGHKLRTQNDTIARHLNHISDPHKRRKEANRLSGGQARERRELYLTLLEEELERHRELIAKTRPLLQRSLQRYHKLRDLVKQSKRDGRFMERQRSKMRELRRENLALKRKVHGLLRPPHTSQWLDSPLVHELFGDAGETSVCGSPISILDDNTSELNVEPLLGMQDALLCYESFEQRASSSPVSETGRVSE